MFGNGRFDWVGRLLNLNLVVVHRRVQRKNYLEDFIELLTGWLMNQLVLQTEHNIQALQCSSFRFHSEEIDDDTFEEIPDDVDDVIL